MRQPLAADLLLLAYDEAGRCRFDSTKLDAGVAGAALVELVLTGALELRGAHEPARSQRLHRVPTVPVDDPLMAEIAEVCDGRKPSSAVTHLAGVNTLRNRSRGLKDELLERLTADGMLRAESHKVLGLFTSTRWRPGDPSYAHALVDELRAVLVHGRAPDQRTAALVSLLKAIDGIPKVVGGADSEHVRARASAVATGDWAGPAVKATVDGVNAAILTLVIAAGGGSGD